MSHRHYNRVPRTREFPVKWWQAALIVAGSVGAIAAIGFLTGTGQAEKKSKKTAQKAKPKQQEGNVGIKIFISEIIQIICQYFYTIDY
jgi:hypothetical protein